MDELDIFLIVYLISFIKACNILEILPLQPRRAVDQPCWRGKDQAFQVQEHSLHLQHVSDNKQKTKENERQTNKQTKENERQTNKQTKENERQTNKQTDKQTKHIYSM